MDEIIYLHYSLPTVYQRRAYPVDILNDHPITDLCFLRTLNNLSTPDSDRYVDTMTRKEFLSQKKTWSGNSFNLRAEVVGFDVDPPLSMLPCSTSLFMSK